MGNQNLPWKGVPVEFDREWWVPPQLDFDPLKLTAEPEVIEQAICRQTSA